MQNQEIRNQSDGAVTGNSCSRASLNELSTELQGYEAELLGHERNGHMRAHLGKSFGRPEGEIRQDIERVTQELVRCNNQYHR